MKKPALAVVLAAAASTASTQNAPGFGSLGVRIGAKVVSLLGVSMLLTIISSSGSTTTD